MYTQYMINALLLGDQKQRQGPVVFFLSVRMSATPTPIAAEMIFWEGSTADRVYGMSGCQHDGHSSGALSTAVDTGIPASPANLSW